MLRVTSHTNLSNWSKGACGQVEVNRVRVVFSVVQIQPMRYVQDGGLSRVFIMTVVGLLDVSGNREARDNDFP